MHIENNILYSLQLSIAPTHTLAETTTAYIISGASDLDCAHTVQSNLVDTEREKQLQHTDFETERVLIAPHCIVYMPLTIGFKHGYLNGLSAEMQLVL